MNLVQRLYSWLYQESSEWKAGYWGSIPYLLILRCLVALGIWLRFKLHPDHPLPGWAALALVCAIALAFWVHLRPREAYSQIIYGVLLVADIVLISTAYWHTGRLESDFYLFYYLPIFTAAEYLRARWVVFAFFGSTLAFACVIFGMPADATFRGVSTVQLFARVFLAREVFYIAMSLVWALRLNRERDSRQRSIVRQLQMQQVLTCKRKVDQTFAVEEVLRVVVRQAAEDLEAPSVVGMLLGGRDGTETKIVEWSGDAPGPDPEGISLCEAALQGQSPGGSTPIVALGGWIGALAASGLNPRERVNSSEYLRSVAALTATAYERAKLFEALREIGTAAAMAVELNQKLESMLDYLVDELEFEYATISLVDNYKDRILTVRGRNVPPGWIRLSAHDISSTDILAEIVRTGNSEVLDSYDPRFNFPIWKRFDHQRLARVFVPIVSTDGAQVGVVGTIEAGCSKDRRTTILDPNVEAVKRLGRESGALIARSLPTVLLELIAERTVDLIGADSASLHVFKGEKEFLVAGGGKADKAFLREHPPSEDGMGRRAMATGKRIIENRLPLSKRALYARGVRSMAAFPLMLTNDVRGVLYVHYWREHVFTKEQLELVRVFVPEMEVAIQNSLLLRDFSKIDEKAWMVTGLQNVMASLGSNLDMDHLLQRLAADALYMLDAKNVTLYEYRQKERVFGHVAVTAGRFEVPEEMVTQVRPDDIVAKVVAKGQSRFVPNTAKEAFLCAPRTDNISRPRFAVREGIKSCAILVLKSPYDGEIVGCLFANYDEFQNFDSVEKKGIIRLAYSLAAAAAVAIKTARLHALDMLVNQLDIDRRERELDAFRAVDRAMVSSSENLDISAVCDTILQQALDVLGLSGDAGLGDVTLSNEVMKGLEIVAVRGYPADKVTETLKLGLGVVCWVAREGKSALIPDVSLDRRYYKIADAGSELAVPILDVAQGQPCVLGVINVEHPNVNAFSERDRAFLETLAVQATIAIHTVQLSQKLWRQLSGAMALGTVGKHILKGKMQLDTLLRLILTGLTAKDGLGFSRAILFEVKEEVRVLNGFLGVGALGQDQAEKTWRGIAGFGLESLLDWAEQANVSSDGSELHRTVKTIQMPVDALKGTLGDCLSARGVSVFHFPAAEFRGTPLDRLYENGDHCDVACVPVRSAEKTIGVLLVDNRFLYHERTTDVSWDPMLITFAELAAMCIEGARLQERLADESQLANWREASSRVAHAFKSHIMNLRSLPLDAAASLRAYDIARAQAQLEELERNHKEIMLRFERIQSFSAPQRVVLSRLDLADVLRHTIESCSRNISFPISPSLPKEPVYVYGDALHMGDIFTELLYNAERAMTRTSAREPRVIVALSSVPDESVAVVDIEDNGCGIPPEIQERIFEPYVTGSASTGLGLAIAKELLEQHGGTIAFSTSETGTRFTLRFPASYKEATATA